MLFAWPLALAYLYPDGRLPSRRWRPMAAVALASCGGAMLLLLARRTCSRARTATCRTRCGGLRERSRSSSSSGRAGSGVLGLAVRRRAGPAGALQGRRPRPPPPGPVAGLRRAAACRCGSAGRRCGRCSSRRSPTPTCRVLSLLHVWLAVAVAVAVTRHGLYAIDRLLNRTLVYALLTALLAGTYAAVALLAGLLAGDSALPVALATLAAALAFRPLRDRLQAIWSTGASPARATRGCGCVRDLLEDVRDGAREPEDVGAVAGARARRPERGGASSACPRRAPTPTATATSLEALPDDGRARTPIGRDRPRARRAAARSRPRPAAGPAARAARRCRRSTIELGVPARRAAPAAGRGGVLAGADRAGRLRGAPPARARPARRRAAAPGDARHRAAPAAALAAERRAGARAGARRRGRRGRRPRSPTCGRSPPACGRRGSTTGSRRRWRTSRAGAAVPVDVEATGDRAPPEVEAVAYFIACEAITNAVKHARAVARVGAGRARRRRAAPRRQRRRRRRRRRRAPARGLAGIADRVAAQGGSLALESPAGAGTRIAVELPCAS